MHGGMADRYVPVCWTGSGVFPSQCDRTRVPAAAQHLRQLPTEAVQQLHDVSGAAGRGLDVALGGRRRPAQREAEQRACRGIDGSRGYQLWLALHAFQ